MKQKLMQAMMEREQSKMLSGIIEIDNAYLCGERSGTLGRAAEGEIPFLATVKRQLKSWNVIG